MRQYRKVRAGKTALHFCIQVSYLLFSVLTYSLPHSFPSTLVPLSSHPHREASHLFFSSFILISCSFLFVFVLLPLCICYLYFSLAGKESTCNAGDPSSIPGSGRSPGERISYPLQYSWAYLMIQKVKNLPAMRETWVQSLGWEGSLEVGMATQSRIIAWRIPWTEEPGGLQSMGSQRVRHD